MKRPHAVVTAALLSCMAFATPARASDCPPTERSWITLSLDGQSPSEDSSDAAVLYRRVSMLLQAEVERRNLLVCPDNTPSIGTSLPSARVHLLLVPRGADPPTTVDIRVDDALTGKIVSRRVELASVPADSRALVIAVGADELLSASWAELALRSPALVRAAKPAGRLASPPAARRRRVDLFVLANGEIDRAGRPRFGATLGNAWWPSSRFAFSAELGVARSLALSAPDGSVHTDSFLLTAGFVLPLVERANAGLEAGVGARLARVLVRGEARAGATAYHGAFSPFGGEAKLRGWWTPGDSASWPRGALIAHLGAGGWLNEADALDGDLHLLLQRSPFVSAAFGFALQIP